MQKLSKINLLLIITLCTTTLLPMAEDVFSPENVLKTAQEAKAKASNLFWPDTLNLGLKKESKKVLDELNANIGTFNTNFENTIFSAKNSSAFRKACAFTLIGSCLVMCGIKLFYDSCKDFQKKLDDEKNKNKYWYKALSWRDIVSPCLSIFTCSVGCAIISKS